MTVNAVRPATNLDLSELEDRVNATIAHVEGQLHASIAHVETRLGKQVQSVVSNLKWTVGIGVGMLAIIVPVFTTLMARS